MTDLRDGLATKVAGARRSLLLALGVAVVAAAPGCEANREVDPGAGLAAARSGELDGGRKAVVGTSFDLGAVIEQVHYAFREREGAWRGGHTTYEVALRDGTLEVKPWHHPGAGPPGAALSAQGPRDRGRRWRGAPPRREEAVEGSATRFGPARLERGGTLLAEGPGTAANGERGRLEVARGPVTEQLTNGPAGVEQSWRFPALPEGDGDLEVRIRLVEGAFVGETEGGLHFAAGALGVRYGHGRWIDALGTATPVPARWDGSAVVLTVTGGVLEGSIYPATLDPIISPELGMDEPVYGPAGGGAPAVASDGSGWLVVWADTRPGTWGTDVHGARVSATGSLLDEGGISISAPGELQESPAVAWGGDAYLVVWDRERDVYGARVSASGAVLDAAGIPIATSPENQGTPAVAWGGDHFLVVWVTWGDQPFPDRNVRGARMSASGSVLDGTEIPIATGVSAQGRPAVAWGGASHLVVWEDSPSDGAPDILGARVSASGDVLDGAGIPIAAGPHPEEEPAVAWNGSAYLVVWSDSGTGQDIHGARVSASGSVLDAPGIPISTAANAQLAPAVAWNGSDYLVAWRDERGGGGSGDVYGARVSASGTVRDGAGIPISTAAGGQESPALAWNGSNHLVAWADRRDDAASYVYGARVSASGTVLDAAGIAIATAANAQYHASVAWGGSEYLAVWADYRNAASTGSDVFGARLGAAGNVLDAAGIAISTAANVQYYPAVAWGGSGYLVVWMDHRNGIAWAESDVYGARVSASGSLLDAAGFPISTAAGGQWFPSVASDGSGHLVVWEDGRSGSSGVYGARVSASGEVLDPSGIAIATASYHQSSPAVGWGGSHYLVVWEDGREASGWYDIYGARVNASGSVLDAAGIAISTAPFHQRSPVVAWDGSGYLVVWADARNEVDHEDVYGARVSPAGSVLDAAGIPIATAPESQYAPAVAWDGSSYLVVWTEYLGENHWSGVTSDLWGARVDAGGGVLDGGPFLVSAEAYDREHPSVASPGPRRFLVVYHGFDTRPGAGATRVLARDVLFDAPPEALAQAVTTDEDVPIAVTLTGTDADGDALTYTVVTPPSHGTLGGAGAELTYTPAADYHGPDAFTFAVSDGTLDSAPATVDVTVRSVNDGPVALAQAVRTDEDEPKAITLAGTDADGDALTYAVVTPPSHGTLGGTAPDLTYAPATGYSGSDAFTFKVNDGVLDSSPATVGIEVADKGCSCATGVDPTSPGVLLAGLLALRRRWRAARPPAAG